MRPVSEKALIGRINRRLKPDGELVRTARSLRAEHNVGRHYRLDVYRNLIVEMHVDLEELGRRVGALRQSERLDNQPVDSVTC